MKYSMVNDWDWPGFESLELDQRFLPEFGDWISSANRDYSQD